MGRHNVVLRVPGAAVVVLDFLEFDLDVHVLKLRMIIIVCVPVGVDHCYSRSQEVSCNDNFTCLNNTN